MEPLLVFAVALGAGALGLLVGAWADRSIDAAIGAGRRVPPLIRRGSRPGRRSTETQFVTAFAFTVFTWWFMSTPGGSLASTLFSLGAYLAFIAVSIPLIVIDVTCHRLPDAIVLPAYVLCGALLAIAASIDGDAPRLGRTLMAMVLLFLSYFAVRVISPRALGGGDVKLAGVLGLLLGWCGWFAVGVGVASSFVLAGVYSVVLIVARRADRRTAIPFGPWMILGAWIAIVLSDATGAGIA